MNAAIARSEKWWNCPAVSLLARPAVSATPAQHRHDLAEARPRWDGTPPATTGRSLTRRCPVPGVLEARL
jgi:hypothetical protein